MRLSPAVLVFAIAIAWGGLAWGQTPPPGDGQPSGADAAVLLAPESAVACTDGPLQPTASDAFAPTLYGTTFTTPQVGNRIDRVVYRFAVSREGRPLSIALDPAGSTSSPNATVDAATQAAFASWTFPHEARSDCRLTLRYVPTPMARAEPDLLARYYALTRPGGALRQAVERRLRRPGDDCDRPPPLRNLAYPDFLKDRPRPGSRSWAAVRWDIAPDGSTRNVETVASSGDEVLNAEGRRAIAETRYRSGPRTGCLYNYWRDGPALPAPPLDQALADDPLQQCSASVASRFIPGALVFPPAFEALGIEGWVRVRFDLATWGQVGNVSVVDAQPAAAFGEPAMRIVTSGRATPAFEAAIRCVVPVRFRLPNDADAPNPARLPGTDAGGPSPPPARTGPPPPF